MLLEFEKHINKNFAFLKDKKLLIAISGGIDSVVLTHLLQQLKYNISLAHCNFMLRGKQSDKDELFVKNFGKKLKIETYTVSFDTSKYVIENKISTQMAARELRYKYFKKLCDLHHFDYIVTAHQQDDDLETFIINLTRGTGLSGLTGVPEINKNVVRPMLIFSRNNVLVYATKNKLTWREDESNTSLKYHRNKIRHKVIPVLKELNPNLLNSFTQTVTYLKGSEEIIKHHIQKLTKEISEKKEKEIYFSVKKIKELPNPKAYLFEILKPYGFTEWTDVALLLTAQTGKKVKSKTHILLKNREHLIISKLKNKKNKSYNITKNTKEIKKPLPLKFITKNYPVTNKKNDTNPFDEIIFNSKNKSIVLDLDKLQFPLTLRKWEKGDSFYPLGLKGQKKLSKFFKDEKLSVLQKENTWLLCSNQQIVWVVGMRIDDRFKVTSKTKSTYIIEH